MRKILPVLCTWMILAVGACSVSSPTNESIPEDTPEPVPEANTISGRVENLEKIWPERDVVLFAATFTGAAESEGYFVLEPDRNPHIGIASNGSFILSALPPGQYILLAGPTAEEARKLILENGETAIFQIENDQKIELGSTFLPE